MAHFDDNDDDNRDYLIVATWNHMIISIWKEYLKLYNCGQIICII